MKFIFYWILKNRNFIGNNFCLSSPQRFCLFSRHEILEGKEEEKRELFEKSGLFCGKKETKRNEVGEKSTAISDYLINFSFLQRKKKVKNFGLDLRVVIVQQRERGQISDTPCLLFCLLPFYNPKFYSCNQGK